MRDYNHLYNAVQKNIKYGFYELSKEYRKKMPDYYKDEYFQLHTIYKRTKYDELDMKLRRNHYTMKLWILEKMVGYVGHGYSFLDVGAGEGYALSFFDEKGWKVTGIDYSSYGIKGHNPSMLQYLYQGDFYKAINEFEEQGKVFDFINADNVLEHLPYPEKFFLELKKVCHKGSILCVTVPNDFSRMQQLAYDMGKIDDAFWVTKETSEHFSYFSIESLCNLGAEAGFNKVTALSDWPIDFFLLHDGSNYEQNRKLGHDCHVACASLENALFAESMQTTVELFVALANAGIGREISVYFRL